MGSGEHGHRHERPSRHRALRQRIVQTLLALLALGVVAGLVFRAPSALHDFIAAFSDIDLVNLPWLLVAAAGEAISFVAFAELQAILLRVGEASVSNRQMLRLSVASTGLRELLPLGAIPASGWLIGQYERLGSSRELALFDVFASGFVSTVAVLGLLIVGAAIAGVGSYALLVAMAALLAAGSAAFIFLVHRLHRFQSHLSEGPAGWRDRVRRAAAFSVRVVCWRVGWRRGTYAFACSVVNWLGDGVCLITAFTTLGLPVPWRGLLFAFSASQVAGSLAPLPGGLGAVEGGIVGGLSASGVPAGEAFAAAVMYRVITYWSIAILGGGEFLLITRRESRGAKSV